MSTSVQAPFARGEWSFLATLLGMVAEQFAHKSCTDFPLAATAENKAIVSGAIERAGRGGDWGDDEATWEDYVCQVMAEEDEIVALMDWVADYLAARCRAVADATGAQLNGDEMGLVILMLDVALEDHDEAEESGVVPYAVEESDENRDILARISDKDTRAPDQETRVPLKAILMHFMERCESTEQR